MPLCSLARACPTRPALAAYVDMLAPTPAHTHARAPRACNCCAPRSPPPHALGPPWQADYHKENFQAFPHVNSPQVLVKLLSQL